MKHLLFYHLPPQKGMAINARLQQSLSCYVSSSEIGRLLRNRSKASALNAISRCGFVTTSRYYADRGTSVSSAWPREDVSFPTNAALAAVDKLDRDFFISVLSSTSTRREAKSYLQKFAQKGKPAGKQARDQSLASTKNVKSASTGAPGPQVNLGALYLPIHSAERSPVFTQQNAPEKDVAANADTLHTAIIVVRSLDKVTDPTLNGVAHTLSQLGKLGMSSILVVDAKSRPPEQRSSSRNHKHVFEDAGRLCEAINACNGTVSRLLEGFIGVKYSSKNPFAGSKSHNRFTLPRRGLLTAALKAGQIPVVIPTAYDESHTNILLDTDDAVLALAQEFSSSAASSAQSEASHEDSPASSNVRQQISLDRIIVLDPLGGIPAEDRGDGAHVFINLEQEFNAVQTQLHLKSRDMAGLHCNESTDMSSVRHLQNLELTQKTLDLLPTSSSALITTPEDAANLRRSVDSSSEHRVGTRRRKNTLIHNLLTDKPSYSPSLPGGRTRQISRTSLLDFTPNPDQRPHVTTFLKKGMPLHIIPDPHANPWTEPKSGTSGGLSLQDPNIDVPRLVNLIEDSFGRKLDVDHYFSRIKDRLAGLIIAGNYEGGAILTWESPPTDGLGHDSPRLVPYLDKIAVLKRSQGTGSVADIVFKAMVRTCFPSGVCWRSRLDNPVNKWYFERSRGTWAIPDTNWTMFWTTEGLSGNDPIFNSYEGVCRQVEPSWADKKMVAD